MTISAFGVDDERLSKRDKDHPYSVPATATVGAGAGAVGGMYARAFHQGAGYKTRWPQKVVGGKKGIDSLRVIGRPPGGVVGLGAAAGAAYVGHKAHQGNKEAKVRAEARRARAAERKAGLAKSAFGVDDERLAKSLYSGAKVIKPLVTESGEWGRRARRTVTDAKSTAARVSAPSRDLGARHLQATKDTFGAGATRIKTKVYDTPLANVRQGIAAKPLKVVGSTAGGAALVGAGGTYATTRRNRNQ